MKAPTQLPAHLPALDGLRGIAILLVIFNHTMAGLFFTPTVPLDRAVRFVALSGWMGVDLFFVLSGFLVTGILLDTQGQPNRWRNFMARRVLRIFPLYYGALVLLFVVLPRTGWQDPEFVALQQHQGWFWTYTVNIFEGLTHGAGAQLGTQHLWSLSIEEQFYLLWPLVVWRCRPKTLLWICALTPVAGFIFRAWLVFHSHDLRGAYLYTPGRFDALVMGAALAMGARQYGGLMPWRKWVAPALMISVGGLGVIAVHQGFSILNTDVGLAAYPLIALMFASVLLAVVTGSGASPLGRALRNPTLRRWGRYSYGIYLVHYPITALLQRKTAILQYSPAWARGSHFPALLVFAVITAALSYATAWCSYHGYEKHFLGLKRYFEAPAWGVRRYPSTVTGPIGNLTP